MNETNQKIRLLKESDSDWEWYPTTDEILQKMNKDIYDLFKSRRLGDITRNTRKYARLFDSSEEYKNNKKHHQKFCIETFLDVGAGDGRVFDVIKGFGKDEMSIKKRYGIEKARAQVQDLIKRNIFIIGGDFFNITLIDKYYSVIFSNPPYSVFEIWVEKLLKESNFGILYLVVPIRWKNNETIVREFDRHEITILGEYTFENGDREARGRVNLIRVMHRYKKIEGIYAEVDFQDAFTRWIDDTIGGFRDEEEDKEIEEEKSLKLSRGDIGDLLENYEFERKGLAEAFTAIGKLPSRTIHAIGLSRDSIHEIIRKDIESLKEYHWNHAFDKLSVINSRLTKDVRNQMFRDMDEFRTLDFNEDNIYSIVIWVINHCNMTIPDQICKLFDEFSDPRFAHAYKSNVHWEDGSWKYNYKKKPTKYYLDYRIVTRSYIDKYAHYSIVDDFIVICKNLGFTITDTCRPDYTSFGDLQTFYTPSGDVAFTVRMYLNGNFHFKINQKLMLRFNVEVAKTRKWLTCPKDIQEEFDVSEADATDLWKNSGILLLQNSDMKLIGFDPKAE